MGLTTEDKRFFESITEPDTNGGRQVKVELQSSGTAGLATAAKQDAEAVLIGAVTETAPATDTASSGLNGRLQRIAQRLTTLIANIAAGLSLKSDIGRVAVSLYANNAATGATTVEATVSLNQSVAVAAVVAGVSYVIPAGKTFRIKTIKFSQKGNAVATLASTIVSLRYAAAGTVGVASAPILFQENLTTPAVANALDRVDINVDGYDIVGDGTAAIGVTVNSTFIANAPTISVSISGALFTT